MHLFKRTGGVNLFISQCYKKSLIATKLIEESEFLYLFFWQVFCGVIVKLL